MTRLRSIDLSDGTPVSNEVTRLKAIARLQRLTIDGVREVAVVSSSSDAQEMPSLDAIEELLDACPSLVVHIRQRPPVARLLSEETSDTAEEEAEARQNKADECSRRIDAHPRIVYTKSNRLAPPTRWPHCDAHPWSIAMFVRPSTQREQGRAQRCVDCKTTSPSSGDFLVCNHSAHRNRSLVLCRDCHKKRSEINET